MQAQWLQPWVHDIIKGLFAKGGIEEKPKEAATPEPAPPPEPSTMPLPPPDEPQTRTVTQLELF